MFILSVAAQLTYAAPGDLSVSDAGSGNIYKFTPGGTRSSFASGLSSPAGLAFDSAGDLFEADAGSGQIFKFTPDGSRSTFASRLNSPIGLAFDSAGNLFEADSFSGHIYKFTSNGTPSTFTSNLSFPGGLAFDSAGNLFEADAGSGQIFKFTPDGSRSIFYSGLSVPFGLAFDSAGNLFEADKGSGQIFKFTPNIPRSTFASGLNSPAGLAFDSAGNLFVADAGSGHIFKFTPGGTQSTFASNLSNPTFLAFEPPGGPIGTTNAATNVTSSSATLNGTVSPNGLTTSVYFRYGTTTGYGSRTSSQSYNGSTTQSVRADITGLSPSTTYHFQIVAMNTAGTSVGSDRTFTTPGPPIVMTNPATNVASFSATLNGSLDPHGLTTSVYFQYGTTTNYGHTTSVQNQTGNTFRNVSANIGSLSAHTIYHFRIVAGNSGGTSFGSDRTFTTLSATGPPVVTTTPPTNMASFSATLNGSLDPHGSMTSVSFRYGPTTSYGFTTPVQTQTGNTFRNISANIIGLSASHIYHFRIVASNSGGTSNGSDRTFTTLSATGAPVVTTSPATNVASSSATLNGSLDPHGLSTSVHFQYGTTTSYEFIAAAPSQNGNTFRTVSANISDLTANTIYHYRIVATNSGGTSNGSDSTLTTLTATGPPVVTTNPATNVASSSATLNGSLDPHGLTTSVSFQYGTTTTYGHTTSVPNQTGNTFRNVSANIGSLSAHTTYHFRIIATNSGGTRLGSDRTFTTP